MDEALGVILLAAYIVGVVALAAGMTFAVVKLFPTKDGEKPQNGKRPTSTSEPAARGRLFRRAKRGAT